MQRDGWRLGLLAREAARNVFGRGSRMLVVLALAILAGAASSAYIALDTQSMRDDVQDLAADGRNVLVFSAMSNDAPASIQRASCEALAEQHGVLRAGILDPAGQLDVLPVGPRLPAQRASSTLFPELVGADLLVGRNLSDRAERPFTVWAGQDLATAVHADPHPEDLGTGSSVTLPPRPTDTTSTRCVVVLDAFSDVDAALPTVAAGLKVSDNPVSGAELLTATNDPVNDYLQRLDRWFPVLLGLLGGAAMAITTRLRASEIAVYRMSGTAPVSVLTLLTLEALLVSGAAAVSATAASLALFEHYRDPAIPILWGLALAGAWSIIALAASLDLPFRRPNDLAKDR